MSDDSPIRSASGKRSRSKTSRFLEFFFWLAVSIATAVILVTMSEQLLPTNF
ncbi:MAG: hypothetical protein ACR2L3_00980 [Actinomycetota bacterium]